VLSPCGSEIEKNIPSWIGKEGAIKEFRSQTPLSDYLAD